MPAEVTKRAFLTLLVASLPGCSQRLESAIGTERTEGKKLSKLMSNDVEYYRAKDKADAESISPTKYPAYIFVESGAYRGIWVVTE